MKTKIFCDSADFKTIKKLNNNNLVDGFTTNPSLMRQAGAKDYKTYSLKLLKVCKKKPISLEVFADSFNQMEKQAYKINSWGKKLSPLTSARFQSSSIGFSMIRKAFSSGIHVSVTLFSPERSKSFSSSGVRFRKFGILL